MAAQLTLQWTPSATAHLRAAYEYIAQDNGAAAESLVKRILSAVEILGQYPEIGRLGRVNATRELVIAGTPFVVVYRIRRGEVDILAVFHAARKWPEEF